MSSCNVCYKVFCHRSKPVSCTRCGNICHTTCTLQRSTGRVCRGCGSSPTDNEFALQFTIPGIKMSPKLSQLEATDMYNTYYKNALPQAASSAAPKPILPTTMSISETTNTAEEALQTVKQKFARVDKEMEVMKSKLGQLDDFRITLQENSVKLDDVDGLRKEICNCCEKLKDIDSTVKDFSQCLRMLEKENKESKARVETFNEKMNSLETYKSRITKNVHDTRQRVQTLEENVKILKVNLDGLNQFRFNAAFNTPSGCDAKQIDDKLENLNDQLRRLEEIVSERISRLEEKYNKEKKVVIGLSASCSIGFLLLTCLFAGSFYFRRSSFK